MSKDTITVSMNVYDIPIVVEAFKKANKEIERLNNIINKAVEYVEESYNETVEGIEGIAKFLAKEIRLY